MNTMHVKGDATIKTQYEQQWNQGHTMKSNAFKGDKPLSEACIPMNTNETRWNTMPLNGNTPLNKSCEPMKHDEQPGNAMKNYAVARQHIINQTWASIESVENNAKQCSSFALFQILCTIRWYQVALSSFGGDRLISLGLTRSDGEE